MVGLMAAATSAARGGGATEPELMLSNIGMTYVDSAGDPLEVFRGLSLDVRAAELCCLAGRSGSGKTTALMIAAGLLAPSAGTVHWGDLDIVALTDDDLAKERGARIGIVFQNAALIPTLRSGENVALAGMASGRRDGSPQRRVQRLLESVGMADRERHYPQQLSGGEQQRVALARALFCEPPLLLIDEPTANLDRRTAGSIITILLELRDRGRALLVATHDTAIADVADRVITME